MRLHVLGRNKHDITSTDKCTGGLDLLIGTKSVFFHLKTRNRIHHKSRQVLSKSFVRICSERNLWPLIKEFLTKNLFQFLFNVIKFISELSLTKCFKSTWWDWWCNLREVDLEKGNIFALQLKSWNYGQFSMSITCFWVNPVRILNAYPKELPLDPMENSKTCQTLPFCKNAISLCSVLLCP